MQEKATQRTHQDLPEPISDADVQLLPVSHEDEPALGHLGHLVQHGLVRGPDPHLLEARPNGAPLRSEAALGLTGGVWGVGVWGQGRQMIPKGVVFRGPHMDISK